MRKLLFLAIGLFLCGCATTTVRSDYDRSTDFSRLKTYAWGEAQKPTGDIRFDDPDLRQVIESEVARQLGSKGLTSATETPDVFLKYYITVEQKEDRMADYAAVYPPSYDPRLGVTGLPPYAVRETLMFQYEEGTFVLDMIDPGTEKILWRGTMEGMVDPGASQNKRVSRVPAAVAKVLAKYPPG